MSERITKYDEHKLKEKQTLYHRLNADMLEAQLEEAKSVLSVIPCDHSNLELIKEREVVRAHIKQLEEQLADEYACVAEGKQATPEEVAAVVRGW